jgi:transposase
MLFESLAIDWLRAASQKAVAKHLGLSWDEIHGIMDRAVERGLARREAEALKNIGVGEKAFRKGHDYITIQRSGTKPRLVRGRGTKGVESGRILADADGGTEERHPGCGDGYVGSVR